MRTLNALWFSVRALLRRRRADEELDEELAYHLERETALLVRKGMTSAAAQQEATRRFGGVQRYREESRDIRRLGWLDDLRADIRFALRLGRHYPAFSANVVVVAGVGIAACTLTFSVVSGVLLSALPFSEPDRIASLQLASREGSSGGIPFESYRRLVSGTPVLEAIARFTPAGVVLDQNGEPEQIRVERVTSSFFDVFGVMPALGRRFTDDEAAKGTPLIVLDHAAWQARFNGDRQAIGQRVKLDGIPHTIIGVMPAGFRGQRDNHPLGWLPTVVGPRPGDGQSVSASLVVRVAPGVTREAAEAWLATVVHAKLRSFQRADSAEAVPVLVPIKEFVYGSVRRPLLVLLGAVGLVLMLVIANTATLFLARTTARDHELSVRRSLGASAGRQVRQLLTESIVLTAVGGALGIVVSWLFVGAIRAIGAGVLPRMEHVTLDWRVLAFAIVATVVAGAVAGLVPALGARRDEAVGLTSIARATRQSHRLSSTLVVIQFALSVVLLVGAGLLVKSFLRVLPSAPGFATDHRATARVRLRGAPPFLKRNPEITRQFVHDVSARMREIDGVIDVAAISYLPFEGMASIVDMQIPGRRADGRKTTSFYNVITPNYLELMRIPILQGRGLAKGDNVGAERVAVINQTAAARWWPRENAVGRRIAFNLGSGAEDAATIVGVVGDARLGGTDTRIRPEIYVPVDQGSTDMISFVAHTRVEPRSVERELRRAIWAVAPALPVDETSDIASIAAESVNEPRFFSVAMAVFAGAAMVLSAFGLYATLAFAVAQRRREIGIRMALGAPSRRIAGVVVTRALMLAAGGAMLGLGLARALTRFMESFLLEVSATDATVFASTAVAMLVIAAIAAGAPAFQALRVDPVMSLRN